MNNEEKKKDLNPPVTGKEPLTEAERIKRKKMIVYALMGLVFIIVMWLIFAPSGDGRTGLLGAKGFNTEMPDANSGDIIGDKTKAYEASLMEDKQQAREQAIGSLGELYNSSSAKSQTGDFSLMTDSTAQAYEDDASRKAKEKITSSAAAYNNLNTTLGGFYQNDQSRENEELRQRVAELEERANELQNPKSTVDEQLELMEKSYQMAAKYMPGGTQQQGQAAAVSTGDKVQVAPVRNVQKSVVSALQQEQSNEEFVADYSVERNMAFNTAVGIVSALDKNTISACIYGNHCWSRCVWVTSSSLPTP